MTQKELLYVEDAIGHEDNIIKIVKHLRPWIGLSMCANAWAVLEMTAGEAERCGLRVGKGLRI